MWIPWILKELFVERILNCVDLALWQWELSNGNNGKRLYVHLFCMESFLEEIRQVWPKLRMPVVTASTLANHEMYLYDFPLNRTFDIYEVIILLEWILNMF